MLRWGRTEWVEAHYTNGREDQYLDHRPRSFPQYGSGYVDFAARAARGAVCTDSLPQRYLFFGNTIAQKSIIGTPNTHERKYTYDLLNMLLD